MPAKNTKPHPEHATLSQLIGDGQEFTIDYVAAGQHQRVRGRVSIREHGQDHHAGSVDNGLAVFDLDGRGTRFVPLQSVRRVSVGGRRFVVSGEAA